MADIQGSTTPSDGSIKIEAESNFLGKKPEPASSDDILYNDFFQESSNGEVIVWSKASRSSLEILVSVMQYLTIFVVIVWIFWWIHVFIRSSDNTSLLENYSFLCPYLNYDIVIDSSEKWCKNTTIINKEYAEKKTFLENNIIEKLTEFIPIKVSSSILDASPERKFVIATYDTKPNINKVIGAFEDIKYLSKSVSLSPSDPNNISCTGLSIKDGVNLSTQCTILGWAIWDDDANGQLGSSRIEALRFIWNISNTYKSSLILNNMQTTLSIEKLSTKESLSTWFSTKTVVPIQVKYIPLVQKL